MNKIKIDFICLVCDCIIWISDKLFDLSETISRIADKSVDYCNYKLMQHEYDIDKSRFRNY